METPQGAADGAQMAELVDALASGASGLTAVEVRVLFWAPSFRKRRTERCGAFFVLAYRLARAAPLLEARSWLSLPVSRAAFAV
mgnify:CR=1 FL=1|jgi:hypothetical protein